MRILISGGERVQPATLRRFAERFARFNLHPSVLRPTFGLAEAVVYVASREAGQPSATAFFDSDELAAGRARRCASGDGTPLVSYGMPKSPTVRIVNPETSTECPAETVGEIWVHGDNVASGYWQKPDETECTFGATLVDPAAGTPGEPWLRTGDLGFISGGELFIMGRIKDLLIVYGRNYAPDDIEATIQAITGGRCVAIAVPDNDGVEKLVTIIELKVRGDSEEAAAHSIGVAKREVTAAISKTHGLSVADLVLVLPQSIPLTTSGKVRRRECRQRYLRDEFTRMDGTVRPPVSDTADTGAGGTADGGVARRLRSLHRQQYDLLIGVVCSQAATVLGRPESDDIDPTLTFRDLGFDSVKATELLDRLKTVTELELSPTLAFDYPTPSALATHLGRLLLGGSVTAAPLVVSQLRVAEPVAVVGMACRFPGGVDSPAALWDLVASGTDGIGGFPVDRGWNLADLFDPDPDAVGKTYARAGGFVTDAAEFDAEFFGISAREARTMDPQQRLLLEVCWEALETARIDPDALAGSETGVFVGAWSQTYGGAEGSDSSEGYGLTGLSSSVASGRVAYTLGLAGPAITVDTACSSSLVATHLACQSLRNGESDLALAGGVTVMTTPAVFTEFARQRGLAADGRCKAFSANADGTVWGEGAAVLVLERLSDAHRNNRPVLAVIAGSAINQDGASNGLTAPNGPAQQRVISQAVANAGIGLDQVDVVEAHGTGTTLGDPIEAGALIATYGAARSAEHPLWLGSVKSNIGHTQAAAGLAGMIKMIEALNHHCLPPTLNVDRPSPHIDWSAGTVRLLTESVPWPVTDHPRTAAVSSFGISGTNAHVIVQQAPAVSAGSAGPPASVVEPAAEPVPPAVHMWPLSARTVKSLAAQADRLHQHLVRHPGLDITDVAYSLAATRTHHPYRATITAHFGTENPREDLLGALHALYAGHPHPQLTQHHHMAHQAGKIVFVFPGQDAQYLGMGLNLYQHHHVFARALDECDQALRCFTGWSVRDVLHHHPAAPTLDRVDVVQPVLFAVMAALAELFSSYGIVPDAVIGHSQGEIAAAYVAGAISLPDAAKVVALRSRALATLSGAGAMASVMLPEEELRPLLQRWDGALSIAAVNGPAHTVVSGDPAALGQLTEACDRDGIRLVPIAVDLAGHCGQVEALRNQLLHELGVTAQPSRIPLYSTVESAQSGHPLDTTEMNADYWYRNLREPVRFYDSVAGLLASGEHIFVELSPHPVLAPAIIHTLAGVSGRAGSAVITTLHKRRPDLDAVGIALAQLQNHGHSPSWSALYPHARTVGLPTYPFEHRRYWPAPAPTRDAGGLGLDSAEHPLLGAVATLADRNQILVSGRLSPNTLGWLAGHQVNDTLVFPAAAFIEVILQAGELSGCPVIDELILHTALILSEQVPTDLQIQVQPPDRHGRRPFSVHSRAGGQHSAVWTLHASGALSADQPAARPPLVPAPSVEALDQDDFYEGLARRGYRYRGPFRSLRGTATDPTRPEVVYAEAALPAGTHVTGYGIHPALLDAALHPLAILVDRTSDADPALLPYTFNGITLYATSATQLHIRLTRIGENTFELHATDPAGAPVITISSLTLVAARDQISRLSPTARLSDSLFELTWRSVPDLPGPSAAEPPATWAVCADSPEHVPASLSNGTIHSDLATLTPCPDLVIWPLPGASDKTGTTEGQADPLRRVHTLTRDALAQLQSWLARPETAGSQLMIVTCHAVSVSGDDGLPNLAHAAIWALIHTAQKEHPGRIILLDADDTAATNDNLRAIASTRPVGEPQLAVRDGVPYLPRLARTPTLVPPDDPTRPAVLDPEGTVLLTGGTGTLGAILAEHLVTRYGIQHLLLLSRSGIDAPGAGELQQRLTRLGAHVAIRACDVSDPTALATALDAIAASHPLTAVIHTAGVVADAVVTDMSPQELEAVLAAKADSAWHLHRLTAERDLAAFVLFSSAAGILGSPGAANYAAANAFLDALARHRHQTNRRATSLAWGYWQTPTGIAHFDTVELTRLTSTGLTPLTSEQGLALFDAALTSQRANLLASPFSIGALTRHARDGTLDPILSTLTHSRPQAATATPRTLTARLAAQSPRQRRGSLTAMVTRTTAAVLAYHDPAALDPDSSFKDLGIDSLTALELRNTLNEQTGLALPATLALDHPTPTALANHLADVLGEIAGPAGPAAQVGTRGDEPRGPVRNGLAYSDQAAFLALRAVHGALMQVTWVYNRAVNVEELQHFQHNLGCGLLGRRIERSPLPFARDRWVSSPASADLDIAESPRRRADVGAWADARARLPIDPEWGPGWHLGVLPLEDGGTAVSLVVSHSIVDAMGFLQAITDAARGVTHNLGYPPAGSRSRRRALREDLRQTINDLPHIAQALVAVAPAVVRKARRDRGELKASIKAAPTSPRTARDDQTVEMPAVMASIDLAAWESCAKRLGASSNSLAAGLACRLAVRVGRVHDDGKVTLRLLASLRAKDDTRGNAYTTFDVTVDPTHAATDLRGMHVTITHATLAAMENSNDKSLALLPLAAMTPKRVVRKLTGSAGVILPVICSNLGELPATANRPDGADADHLSLTYLWPGITKSRLEAIGGQLFLASWRYRGKMFVRICAYLPDRPNTVDQLLEFVARTFAEFDLNAEFDC